MRVQQQQQQRRAAEPPLRLRQTQLLRLGSTAAARGAAAGARRGSLGSSEPGRQPGENGREQGAEWAGFFSGHLSPVSSRQLGASPAGASLLQQPLRGISEASEGSSSFQGGPSNADAGAATGGDGQEVPPSAQPQAPGAPLQGGSGRSDEASRRPHLGGGALSHAAGSRGSAGSAGSASSAGSSGGSGGSGMAGASHQGSGGSGSGGDVREADLYRKMRSGRRARQQAQQAQRAQQAPAGGAPAGEQPAAVVAVGPSTLAAGMPGRPGGCRSEAGSIRGREAIEDGPEASGPSFGGWLTGTSVEKGGGQTAEVAAAAGSQLPLPGALRSAGANGAPRAPHTPKKTVRFE